MLAIRRRVISALCAVLFASVAAVGVGITHAAPAQAARLAIVPANCTNVYTVRSGDTLVRIAARYGTTWRSLQRLNQIDDATRIWPGERVCVSTSGGSAPMSATAPVTAGSPCGADRSIAWRVAVSQWATPPGCFGAIYRPNPVNYAHVSGFGWCSWWPKALRRDNGVLHRTRQASPRVGAVVVFRPYEQGASGAGHYAYVESVGPNGWLLISEMNMYWRGGGWAKVNYRYVRTTPGTSFIL